MPDLIMRKPVVAPREDWSFWLQDIDAGPVTEPLGGNVVADVVIVGGGFTGLWTALRLLDAEPSMKVVILEAVFCGAGASGRNGGQVHSWFAEIDALAAVVGQEEATELCQDTADVIAELRRLQQDERIDMDLRLDGWLWTASSIAQEGRLVSRGEQDGRDG